MVKIGQRVQLVSRVTGSLGITGYLRAIDNNFYTIQSQKGYLKMYPVETYELRLSTKKKRISPTKEKFKRLLQILN